MKDSEANEKKVEAGDTVEELVAAIEDKNTSLGEIESLAQQVMGTEDFSDIDDCKSAIDELNQFLEKINNIAQKAQG